MFLLLVMFVLTLIFFRIFLVIGLFFFRWLFVNISAFSRFFNMGIVMLRVFVDDVLLGFFGLLRVMGLRNMMVLLMRFVVF